MDSRTGPEDFEGQNILIEEALESWNLLAARIPNLQARHIGLSSEATEGDMQALDEGALLELRRRVVDAWFEVKLVGTVWAEVARARDEQIVRRRFSSDRSRPAYPFAEPEYLSRDITERSG